MSKISQIKYCSDIELIVLRENCNERNWKRVGCKGDWNFYWAALPTMKSIFKGFDYRCHLNNHQLINHFPTYNQLSSKNILFKNIQSYRNELYRQESPCAQKDGKGNFVHLGFIPMTFSLPGEFEKLKKYSKKHPALTWIFKPSDKSLGIGIFLINKLSQLDKWTENPNFYGSKRGAVNYVASRYINNPLLIGGKKFDLRLYVLVVSFEPLVVYFYKLGFCRFCQLKYTNDPSEINEMFAHLTNVSIQYLGDKYKNLHGGKWTIQNLKFYLQSTKGMEVTSKLFKDIHSLIVHSLKAAVPHMVQDRHCFECYGYDILISDDVKPWLIEVNALPSLVPTTEKDRELKHSLMNDVLNIMCPENKVPDIKKDLRVPDENSLGNFELIYHEGHEETVIESGSF